MEEVMDYMAFDLSESETFRERIKREKEIEQSRKLSKDEYAAKFKRLLAGGK